MVGDRRIGLNRSPALADPRMSKDSWGSFLGVRCLAVEVRVSCNSWHAAPAEASDVEKVVPLMELDPDGQA